MLNRVRKTLIQNRVQKPVRLHGMAGKLNRVGRKVALTGSIIIFSLVSMPLAAVAQEQTDPNSEALTTLNEITADSVELSRILDYQKELLELAEKDPTAASLARRHTAACGTRYLVKELCAALTMSFPEIATGEVVIK